MSQITIPARGDKTPEAIRARIAEFAEWFGCEPVKPKFRKGAILLTEELLEWVETQGASLDWIYSGDPKSMAATFRRKYAVMEPSLRALSDKLDKLSYTEQKIVDDCLKAESDGRMTFDEAMKCMVERIGAYRRALAIRAKGEAA